MRLSRDQRAAAVAGVFLLSLHSSVPRVEEDDEAAGEQTEESGLHQHRHYGPEAPRQKERVSQVMFQTWKVLEFKNSCTNARCLRFSDRLSREDVEPA